MTRQGIDINVLDGLAMSRMLAVHAAASLSAAKINPVGGLIAGAVKAGSLNKSFQQQRSIPVQPFPIFGKTMRGKRQNLACQAANGYEMWNEETAIGHNELKIPFPLFGTPANPGIPRGHLPCRTRKLQTRQELAGQPLRLHKVIQMGAERFHYIMHTIWERYGCITVGIRSSVSPCQFICAVITLMANEYIASPPTAESVLCRIGC
jgi:hypothetical protein